MGAGVCSGGLGCLVKYNPGVESEHDKIGKCVTEQGNECSNPKSGVSCRPGQLGVPTDFPFCPKVKTCSSGKRKQQGNKGFLFGGQTTGSTEGSRSRSSSTPPLILGGVVESIGSVSKPIRDSIKDTILDYL